MATLKARNDAIKPTLEADGAVRFPAFDLPPSILMSEVGAASLRSRSQRPLNAAPQETDIGEVREQLEQQTTACASQHRHVLQHKHRPVSG
jgi:hypothetical protein